VSTGLRSRFEHGEECVYSCRTYYKAVCREEDRGEVIQR
jgi:hypothetical protein